MSLPEEKIIPSVRHPEEGKVEGPNVLVRGDQIPKQYWESTTSAYYFAYWEHPYGWAKRAPIPTETTWSGGMSKRDPNLARYMCCIPAIYASYLKTQENDPAWGEFSP